jgi:hypothetical protein
MALDLGCDHPGLDLGENGFADREAIRSVEAALTTV